MYFRLAATISLVTLLAAACGEAADTTGSTTPPTTTETTTPPASDDSASLAGTHWVVFSFGIDGADDPVLANAVPTMEFDADGAGVGGTTGCNSYFGTITSGPGSTISFGGIGMTEMACLDEGVMDQEHRFAVALSRIDRFALGDGTLVLDAADGSAVMRLVSEQIEPDLPLAGSWRLTTLIDGDIASSVIAGTEVTLEIDLAAMTINGSGGCNGYGGPIEVEGDTAAPLIPIHIGPLMTTLMACEEGIMDQEAAVVGILGDAATASVNGSLLTISTDDGRELVFESAGE